MHKFLNGIFWLKVLIVVMGIAIVGCLCGVVYGIRHYRTTPKIIPRTLPVKPRPPVVGVLPLNAAAIKDSAPCGKYFCVTVADAAEGDKIAVIDVSDRKVLYWITARGQTAPVGEKP